jgi:trimeric autotransporter adhesin
MKIFQSAELSRHPETNMEAATKFYVDNLVGGTVISGGLFFTNAAPTSTGIVGSKTYVPGTTPANRVISEATTDTDNVTVTLFAEGGGTFYSPTITITTVPPQAGGPITASLTEDPTDKRSYTAAASLSGITADTVITATSTTNATATMTIRRAVAGPNIDVLVIGSLPGTQTEAKAGDVVSIDGRVPNSATYAEIIVGGAAGSLAVLTVGAADSYSPGFKEITGTFVVGSATGTLGVTARARNALGTFGSNFASQNTIVLNQTYPTIGARTITYPATQQGLKGSETATITSTITNANTYLYTGTNLTVTDPTTYSVSKTVTRTGGTYVFGTNNYTISATRTANNATTTASSAVTIADTAPAAAITIVGNPARLFSSPAGTDYTVTITANQRLISAPSLVASSGTWQGSWTGSATTWTRVLRIADTDPKGTQSFSSLSLTNLANVAGSTITSGSTYTVGGFATRTITFPAFARYAPIGTSIVDITKTVASYTGAAALTRQANTANVFQGYTIVDSAGNYSPTGDHLFISDADFAGSNTTGTLQLDIGETV